MAFTAIAQVSAGSLDNQNITTGAITTTGANLIVIGLAEGIAGTCTVSDSKSNTWTEIGTSQAATFLKARMFYCVNPTVGTGHTFSATSGANTFPALSVEAYNGVMPSSALDQLNKAGGDGISTLQPGSVTPTYASELVVTTIALDTGIASINGGFTIATEVNGTATGFASALSRLIQTSIAAANPTWTFDSAAASACAKIATFRVFAGGMMAVL